MTVISSSVMSGLPRAGISPVLPDCTYLAAFNGKAFVTRSSAEIVITIRVEACG
jgi:hypothetical protein